MKIFLEYKNQGDKNQNGGKFDGISGVVTLEIDEFGRCGSKFFRQTGDGNLVWMVQFADHSCKNTMYCLTHDFCNIYGKANCFERKDILLSHATFCIPYSIHLANLDLIFCAFLFQLKSFHFGAKIQTIMIILPVSETNVSLRFPLLTTKSVRSSPTLTTVDMLTSQTLWTSNSDSSWLRFFLLPNPT